MARETVEEMCDNIDAAVFSGDMFDESENRKQLRYFIERWTKELNHTDKLCTQQAEAFTEELYKQEKDWCNTVAMEITCRKFTISIEEGRELYQLLKK